MVPTSQRYIKNRIKKVTQQQDDLNNREYQQQIRNFIQIQEPHQITENHTKQGKSEILVHKGKHHGKREVTSSLNSRSENLENSKKSNPLETNNTKTDPEH